MTSSPNPTWYDILGVAPDATPGEIKTAWRAATDKFEPGSGTSQFRLFNEAADVLLDPERRAEYDAELAGGPVTEVEPAPDVEPVETPAPDVEPVEMPAPDVEPVEAPASDVEPVETPAGRGVWATLLVSLRTHRWWVVAVTVPLLVVSLAVSLVTVFGLHAAGVDVEGIRPQVRAFDAGPEATAAAERALKPVLSYDYRHMEADRDRAAQYLTPAYRKDYLKNFNDLLIAGPDGGPGPAVKTQAVVSAEVLDTGVVDAEADRVRVIAFVNQSSVKGDATPTILQNRLVVTMVHRGDAWLIDKITSY